MEKNTALVVIDNINSAITWATSSFVIMAFSI